MLSLACIPHVEPSSSRIETKISSLSEPSQMCGFGLAATILSIRNMPQSRCTGALAGAARMQLHGPSVMCASCQANLRAGGLESGPVPNRLLLEVRNGPGGLRDCRGCGKITEAHWVRHETWERDFCLYGTLAQRKPTNRCARWSRIGDEIIIVIAYMVFMGQGRFLSRSFCSPDARTSYGVSVALAMVCSMAW